MIRAAFDLFSTVTAPKAIFNIAADGTTLKNIFNAVLALAGAVAVAYIVFAGIKYSMSQGDSNEIKQARDGILYAVIGIVVVVISFMLLNYVIGKF